MTSNLWLVLILILNAVGFLYVIFFVIQQRRAVKKCESLMMAHMNRIKDKKHEPGVIYDGME